MKILYSIQGTGNGHLSRALEIVPILREMAETDVLISGIQGDIKLPFKIQYQFFGISFIFGTKGGVDLWKTISKFRLIRLIKDIIKLPVHKYDLILFDFEPVTAWACLLKGKKGIGVSHQNAVLHPSTPKPQKRGILGKTILKFYAPSKLKYGFHFQALDEYNFLPVIRPAIRNAQLSNKGHYTVYLPSYSNKELEKKLSSFQQVQWEVFSKHCKQTYRAGNILFQPVSLEGFNRSFIHCEGILCNAGFETPAEALHMGKKLCVIPMNNQYEQHCNAAFLSQMGIMVLPNLSKSSQIQINHWLESGEYLHIYYPDYTQEILEMIVKLNTEYA